MAKQYRRRRRSESSESEGDGEDGKPSAPPAKVSREEESRASTDGKMELGSRRTESERHREGARDGRGRVAPTEGYEERGRGGIGGDRGRDADWDRGRDRERDRGRYDLSTRDRDRARERERDRGRDHRIDLGRSDGRGARRDEDRARDRERDRVRGAEYPPHGRRNSERGGQRDGGRGRERDPGTRDASNRRDKSSATSTEAVVASGSKSRGIFSYIGGGGKAQEPSSIARSKSPGTTNKDRGESRTHRPNSAALASMIRGDRRTNIRMDREQYDASQGRLLNLAPEGNEVKDSFSTGCRPDKTGHKEHPFQCTECPSSFPMATQLSHHLERSHDIIRHPSLITPKTSISA